MKRKYLKTSDEYYDDKQQESLYGLLYVIVGMAVIGIIAVICWIVWICQN
jgi:hypothetical protein